MNFLVRTFLSWLPLGIAITLVCLLVYAAVQQNYRQSLNDPQIQIAEDAAAKLASGATPNEVISTQASIDIAASLAPWLAVYNNDGVSIVSSGLLNGEIPDVPLGVFKAAATNTGKDTDKTNEDRVTAQFGAGVRQALVVVAVTSGPNAGDFVVVGRNMREVEDREGRLTFMVGVAWLVTMAATLLAQAFAKYAL